MTRTGAIILTAGEKTDNLDLLYVVEGKTVIDGILEMLSKYEVSPVVLAAGAQKEIVEKHFSSSDVRSLAGPVSACADMLEIIRQGIRELMGSCSRILIIRAEMPAFSEETLAALLQSNAPLVRPVCSGKPGNPFLVGEAFFDEILSYEGEGGLRALLDGINISFEDVAVDDPGILLNSADEDDFERIREIKAREHNHGFPFNCVVDLKLRSSQPFFTHESALLFESIDDTHSIKTACDCMHISYSKAWKMIRTIEEETGIRFVHKTIGGFGGGHTVLTGEGRAFVKDYRNMLEKMQGITEELFEEMFGKYRR